MKRFLSFTALMLLACSITIAQAPALFNYQGVARNSVGNVLANKNISLRLNIRDLTATGTVVYSETRSVTTNNFGLFNVVIGSAGATATTGTITGINWASGAKFIQVDIDPNGGNSFINIGASQLASVPYALSAGSTTPSGPAGGSLSGTYPNPMIGNGAVTQTMLAPGITAIPSGTAGGVLSGSYPNPGISNGAITQAMLAPGITAAPAGAAGGDLSGTYPNPTVSRLQGRAVANTAPTDGQILRWNNAATRWEPVTVASGGTINGTTNTIIKFTGASTGGNSQLTDDGTSVGLNTPTLSPNIKFQVTAPAIGNTIRGTLIGAPPTGIATSGSIYGESTGGIGVIGVSGTQNGVYGLSTGTLGGTVGVATGTGNGIWGVATGGGVAGFFDGGVTGRGIVVSTGASGFGTTSPTNRLMVVQPFTPVPAIDTNSAIYAYSYTPLSSKKGGVYGTYNTSNYGTGLQGIGYQGVENSEAAAAFSVGNQDLGVYGSANTAGVMGGSIGGIGVVGYNRNSSFAATTGGGNTYGVYGYANNIGGAAVPNTRYGVYGYATGATTNWAGYFSGNVQITGSIAKGSGTFKIDHPVDPENKYLYHSFVESPDMMNIYNGNATTDHSGYATVKMPDYFDALNKDFRYQLTVIGKFAQAIVAKEISNNEFVIQTDQPNVKVSWQVTGVRADKYANAHRVIPEVEKEPELKGRYLHAAEWGKPESRSIDAATRPQGVVKAPTQKTGAPGEHPGQPQEQKTPGVAGATIETKSEEKK